MRERFPDYVLAVEKYLNSKLTLSSLKRNRRLDRKMKSLLEVRLLLRLRKFKKAKELLVSITVDSDPFWQGEWNFLQAQISYYENDLENSRQFNQTAKKYYSEAGDRRGNFIASYNLGVDFCRTGHSDQGEEHYRMAESLAATASERFLILRAQACRCSAECQFAEAIKSLDKIENSVGDLGPSERHLFDVVAADIHFRAGNRDKAALLYGKLKHSKVNQERYRIAFELACWKMLDTGVLIRPRIRLPKNSEYFLQWSVLESLFLFDLGKALVGWMELQGRNANKYADNFSFGVESETRSLFAHTLVLFHDRVLRKIAVRRGAKKVEQLAEIFRGAKAPLSKHEIVSSLWGSYDARFDARFYKLLERSKKRFDLNIRLSNARYYLSKVP